jgi:hypothetical protein
MQIQVTVGGASGIACHGQPECQWQNLRAAASAVPQCQWSLNDSVRVIAAGAGCQYVTPTNSPPAAEFKPEPEPEPGQYLQVSELII